jgi:hypothetical protein
MAKITRHNGPSIEDEILANRPVIGGALQSVGGSSAQSTNQPQTNDELESQPLHSPAPTTENPSETQKTESSIAPTTDGNGLETDQQQSGRVARRPSKKARTRTTDEFDDEFE